MSAVNFMAMVSVGDEVPVLGRTKSASHYTVSETTPRGFRVARAATGSSVLVTWAAVARLRDRLAAGEVVRFQGSPAKGGVDCTSAKRDALIWAVSGARRDGDLVVLA
jgi:hypothetical protein